MDRKVGAQERMEVPEYPANGKGDRDCPGREMPENFPVSCKVCVFSSWEGDAHSARLNHY